MAAEGQTPVKINLKTDIRREEDAESYELAVFGRHYRKGGSDYLAYDEVLEEGTVHTIVKIGEGDALILRSGAVKMRLSFHEHEQMGGSHESPFGSLLLTTDTKRLEHRQSGEGCGGRIQLIYELSMQGAPAGEYEMIIDYKEETVKP